MLYHITRLMVNILYSPFTSWMNEYVLHFVYGDLKLHCRHKWMTWNFCSNFAILFSSKNFYIFGRNIYKNVLQSKLYSFYVQTCNNYKTLVLIHLDVNIALHDITFPVWFSASFLEKILNYMHCNFFLIFHGCHL
jgi:hypothetical protein